MTKAPGFVMPLTRDEVDDIIKALSVASMSSTESVRARLLAVGDKCADAVMTWEAKTERKLL